MSVSEEVYRGAGDQPGDEIADPLIGSAAAALARGRQEMDACAHPRTRVEVTGLYQPGLRLGHLVRGVDPVAGPWTGRVTGISVSVQGPKIVARLQIDRPLSEDAP
ncbi:MAG: hypothetical protein HQL51_03875 [Magnetococcales bacterium]|nr:hypothetical protein [Magnetococcales bacterium]